MSRPLSTVVVVAILVVSATGGVAAAVPTQSPEAAGSGTVAESATQGTASVAFDNQSSGGYTVTVDSVTLPEGGYVVMHDATLFDGAVLSSVVGSSAYLEAGTHENVTVRLDDPLSETGTLVAMPHRETDGDRIYEFVSSGAGDDGPYTANGSPVTDGATVEVTATVTMGDQPTDGASLLIDRVELSEGGFVTIHDATLLQGDALGSVRGTSAYLGPGVHENVRIELDDPITENGTFIAMPHRDTNDNRTYDFVTSGGSADGPYTANGSAVVDSASVTLETTASATFDPQASGGNRLVVERAFVPRGGFVTMHDSSLLSGATFDSVRGTSAYLEPGLHRNVAVTLDDPLTADDTLIAMPHRDTNGNQTYDFVTSSGAEDGPYTANGSAVTDAGNVTVAASVGFDTQTSDGRTVTVESVDLSEGGFVTIHDPSLFAGATLGSIRGTSAYLGPGVHEDVTVTLDRPVTESQTLVAMAHRDTNDNETYDFVTSGAAEDGPYVANGSAVVDPGRALVTASVTFEDQETAGTTVTVRSVTLHDGGFVTMHDSSLLSGATLGSIRGTSAYLGPGTHENVTVTLDDPLEANDTLIAMPHRDTNGNQTYDFVTSGAAEDGPYVAAGGAVVAPGNVTVGPGAQTPAVAQYENANGVVTTDALRTALGDWSNGNLPTEALVAVIEAWARGG